MSRGPGMDICRDTALRLYELCKAEPATADPDETVSQMANAIHDAMFRAAYCEPRCESRECKQGDGGQGT